MEFCVKVLDEQDKITVDWTFSCNCCFCDYVNSVAICDSQSVTTDSSRNTELMYRQYCKGIRQWLSL